MNQSSASLSQMNALMVEALRQRGFSDTQIIEDALSNQLPKDDSIYEFDFSELSTLAHQDLETLKAALHNGYQIKYNTIRGIRSWIAIVYELEAKLVLEEGQEAVYAKLDKQQQQRLEQVLSHGWKLSVVNEETNEIVVKPA